MRNIFLLLFLKLILTTSCNSEKESKIFYFDLSNPNKVKNYHFTCKEDSTKNEIWRIYINKEKKQITTVRNLYNSKVDSIIEQITESGSILIDYYRFLKSKTNLIKVSRFYPIESEIINWNKTDKAVYSGEFVKDAEIWKLIRSREFVQSEKINVLNQLTEVHKYHDTLDFRKLNLNVHRSSWGFDKAYEDYTQNVYFAKNIGLVKYEIFDSDGIKYTLELSKIL